MTTGAGDGFRVIVPTRDSAAWVAALVEAYEGAGVRPLFIVDSRSRDATHAVLLRLGADTMVVSPTEDRVEDIIWRFPSLTDAAWVLRIDDDEMPSNALLLWVRTNLPKLTLSKVAFPRHWAMLDADGSLRYARHQALYYMKGQPDLLDPQVRLYQPAEVSYVRNIHTPGFSMEGGLYIAPPEALICHFDWIARSFEERRAKLLRYEAELPGCAGALLSFYLPELMDPAERCEGRFDTDEFNALAAMFAATRRRRSPLSVERVAVYCANRTD